MNKMNQTQTRSPRKRWLSLLLAVVLVVGLLPISAFASNVGTQADDSGSAAESQEFMRIFHLDCGRKYFSVNEIEGIIDQLAANHYTHIQLAFGNDGLRFLLDDMSVTVNGTEYSSENVKGAIEKGNSGNGLARAAAGVLTQSDMDTIIDHAKEAGIEVIPMFNAPGHMYTAIKAMNLLGIVGRYSGDSDASPAAKALNWSINPTDSTAVAYAEALLTKYVEYFASKGSTRFNIGADESGLNKENYLAYAKMVNDMNAIVKAAGMTTLAYNDGIYNTSYSSALKGKGENGADYTFNTDIVICYWTTGNGIASAESLSNEGFKILNNTNNWYYVLGDGLYKSDVWGAGGQWGYSSALEGLKSTKVTQVKGDEDTKAVAPIGSVLCCWCDVPSIGYTDKGIKKTDQTNQESVYALIKAMADANPDYFKEYTAPQPELSVGTAQGVTVSATKGNYQVFLPENPQGQTMTVQLSMKNLAEGQTAVWSSDNKKIATVATDNGLVTFTGETGTVTITAVPQSSTNDGETAAYTVTFDVKAADEANVVDVTVSEGRTSEAYDVTGENLPKDGSHVIAGGIASYTIATSTGETTATKATSIDSETGYIIGNGSQYLKLNGSSITSTTDPADATNWTITSSGTGYTIKSGNYYLGYGRSGWQYSPTASSTQTTWNWSTSNGFYVSIYNYNYYLTYSNGWALSYAPTAANNGQPYTTKTDPAGTTVTFTGLKVGTTSVAIGDTTYRITVTEKKIVEIPITIVDYRADGLLFDWTYSPDSEYSDSYRYGLVHSGAEYWGSADSSHIYAKSTYNSETGLYEVNGETASNIEQIAGTTIQKTGSVYPHTDFYPTSTDNDWSRAGLVQERLGTNGMPVYTDAAVQYVAGLLEAGYYNKMDGSCNSVIYDTFVDKNGSRSIRDTSTTEFSAQFEVTKSYANISNAYDLAWYLLNTIYQPDTEATTTVTGTDEQTHSVPIYGMAVDAYKSIVLTDDGSGVYSFEADYSGVDNKVLYDTENKAISNDDSGEKRGGFYPLENLGYEQPDLLTATSMNKSDRNGNFTLRGESQFVYNKGANLYFTFTGDDDVYMYINGVLALDLGGSHGRNTKKVNLNELDKDKYGLVDGQVATFTFFYMERCSDASTFAIETNMELVQREIEVQKKAYDTHYDNEIPSSMSVSTGTTVAYDLILTNKSNTVMNQIVFSDEDDCGASVSFGSGVTNPSIASGTEKENGTVTLGHLSSYVIYITEGENEVENTRQTLTTLKALSEAVAKTELKQGQSLHVRFLTATFNVKNSSILSYLNKVTVEANVSGTKLSDTASHELYSYNANDIERTYVVDFGLPLRINNIFKEDVKENVGDVKISSSNTLKYGTVTLTGTGAKVELVYTRTAEKTIDNAETIVLDVEYKMGSSKVSLQKTLTIIPASNVYYEDSLASFTDGSGVAEDAKWSIVDNNDQTTAKDGGNDVYQALEQLGEHENVYGYDKAYDSSSKLSMGTAHKVTVKSEMLEKWEKTDTESAWPTASFTFTGTGFDIISLTNNKSGAIFVDVYAGSKAEGKAERKYVVNNYYGYTYENGQWVVKQDASDTLYQIPVMKITDLGHGEHTVVIKVAYSEYFDTASKNEYNFWLDAIRVYNPMGEGYDDYTADNEGYPQYIKLRDELAKTAGTNDGVVFIDGADNATIEQYANYGPNNEVYLANGQAITFKVPATAEIASIQIGAKAPNGKANMLVKDGNSEEWKNQELNTATEMYYEISKTGDQFTISNTGEGILSLTNLKITYTTGGETVELSDLTAKEQENAVAMVRALFAVPVETFQPERFEASWGSSVRAGRKATLTVKASEDVDAITVDGVTVSSYTTRTERTGWGWWSPKVTYRVFTYTITAPAQTTDYAVCAVNAEGTASEAVTATLTVRPATWWNWWF